MMIPSCLDCWLDMLPRGHGPRFRSVVRHCTTFAHLTRLLSRLGSVVWVTEPRRSYTSRVRRYRDLVGCVLALVVVIWDRLMSTGKPAFRSCAQRPRYHWVLGGRPPRFSPASAGFDLLPGSYGTPLVFSFRGMPIEMRYFWSHRECLGYGHAPGSHIKKVLCQNFHVGIRKIPLSRF